MKKTMSIIAAVLMMATSVNAACTQRTRVVYYSSGKTNVYTVGNSGSYYKSLDSYLKDVLKKYETVTLTPAKVVTEKATETTTQAAVPTTRPAAVVTEKATETTTQVRTTQTTTQAASANTDTSSVERRILDLVNKQRTANGLSALALDADLSRVALAKAQDMQQKGYFSHTSPTYGSPFDMMKSFGISYRTAGENIAKGQKTPEAVMDAWMNSEGHRKNILGSGYKKLGVGYVNKNGTTYWVQMFIG